MTRRIRPAINPNTSRSVITTRANLSGWAITAGPTDQEGIDELTLARDNWVIIVAFQGQTAFSAAIQYPGQTYPMGVLSLGLMSRYLRGNREQMSAFNRGQRIVVGARAGVVEGIIPDDETKVRLVVRYDDGSVGEPFTTHVRPEGAKPHGIAKHDRVQLGDGTLGVVVLADDHNALLVRPDRSETSTTVAADSVTRLFGSGDEVMANGLVRRVVSYTRNQSYRLRLEESDTVCDFYAWDITPTDEGATA